MSGEYQAVTEDEFDLMKHAIKPDHVKCDKCDDLWFAVIGKSRVYQHMEFFIEFNYGDFDDRYGFISLLRRLFHDHHSIPGVKHD